MMRRITACLMPLLFATVAGAQSPPAQMPPFGRTAFTTPVVIYDALGNVVGFSRGAPGSPTYTTPAGIVMAGYVCTVPAYAAGGTLTCLPDDGSATYTATCAANVPCALPPLAGRRFARFMTLNASGTRVTATYGYGAAVAPGRGTPVDAGDAAGGQGGSIDELPAFSGTYYVTAPSVVIIRFVQG